MHQLDWKKFFSTHKTLLGLLIFYLCLHLINLTLLPPYNDESIYLDWAWSYTHMPGHLYDSLLDAKQPLMIWIFAIFENLFSDPLFAGRFASVLIGSVTATGIYLVTKKILNDKASSIAMLLYAITPIFVFYNRQALMEAGVACIGIWSFYAFLKLLDNPTNRRGMILGMLLGIGFFIKSSSLLFIVSVISIVLFVILKQKKTALLKPFFISIIAFIVSDSLLFVNSVFWQTFSTNDRYSYTISEIFHFPLQTWVTHFLGFFDIGFFFMTPLVFVCSIVGIYQMKKEKIKYHQVFFVYFIFALTIEIFSGRYQNQRYLMPFLPFLIVSASYVLSRLWNRVLWKKMIVVATILVPLILSLILIMSPDYYIMSMSKISAYSNVEHVRGQMSGYGIKEVMQYIKDHSSSSQPTLVFFALNAGNPENAVDVYSQKEQFYPLHIDANFFPEIDQIDCLTSKYPAFFVTRYDQRVGMDRFFILAKSFSNPDGKYSIGIYTLKKGCSGKTLSLSDFYQGALSKIWLLRNGSSF